MLVRSAPEPSSFLQPLLGPAKTLALAEINAIVGGVSGIEALGECWSLVEIRTCMMLKWHSSSSNGAASRKNAMAEL